MLVSEIVGVIEIEAEEESEGEAVVLSVGDALAERLVDSETLGLLVIEMDCVSLMVTEGVTD